MQHGSMLRHIARFAQGVAERPVQIQEARRMGGNRDFFHERQTNRCDAPGFDFSCEQPHGPRADRSSGHQQSQVNAGFAQTTRSLLDRRHKALGAAHQAKTVMFFGQPPNDFLGLKLA